MEEERNKCSDYSVRGCPASSYLSCSAYKEGKNCWEMVGIDIPCCKRNNKSRCSECSVYQKTKELGAISNPSVPPLIEKEKEAMNRGKEGCAEMYKIS